MTNSSSRETNDSTGGHPGPARRGPTAILAVLGAALLFSTGGVAIKSVEVSPWAIAAGRSLVAAGFLFAAQRWLTARSHAGTPPAAVGISGRMIFVAVAYGATLALYVLANRATTATNAIALQSTAPLHMLYVGPLLFGEFVRRRDFAPTAIVAVGTTLILVAPEPVSGIATHPALGNGYALASGVTWALTLGGLRQLSQRGESALRATVIGNALVAVGLCPCLFEFTSAAPRDLGLIAFLGVAQIGFAYLLLTHGLARMRAWTASIVLLVEPVANPIWVGLAHGEWPSLGATGGGMLLVAGATFVAVRGPAETRNSVTRGAVAGDRAGKT